MRNRRRGTILIITIGVLLVLSSMVLVFARTMRVEATASANAASAIQAASIERAAEQYAIAQIMNQPTGVPEDVFTMDDTNWAGLQVGDGYFWIIRPDYGDQQFSQFGLVDESAKLNLNMGTDVFGISNTEKSSMFAMLPGMTQDLADSIIDWQDTDENITGNGAESNYYMSLPSPYMAKNDTFESVEELLLVKGFSRQLLYGLQTVDTGANPNGNVSQNNVTSGAFGTQTQTTSSMMTDDETARGIYDLLTVWSKGPVRGANGVTRTGIGVININRAPQEVVACLPGLTDSDVQAIMSARTSASSSTDISWVQQAIPNQYQRIRSMLTGNTHQFSAEIVAVSGDGRAFKRARIVIDLGVTGTNPPKIVFRRDLTDSGWPLALEILESLRSGQGLPAIAYTSPVRRTM